MNEELMKKLQEIFGEALPAHPSTFYTLAGGLVSPSDIKKYNTGNNVRAYNIFKDKYYEFIAIHPKELTLAEKLAVAKASKQSTTEVLK